MPGLPKERDQDLVDNLSSMDELIRLKALRAVKNQIIGNKSKKTSYLKLGAVNKVVEILSTDSSAIALVQSAAAVGSFAYGGDEGMRAVLDCNVLPALLRTLSHADPRVVEAGARSLKMIFNSSSNPVDHKLQESAVRTMLTLLESESLPVSEVAMSMLARCCQKPDHQAVVASNLPQILHFLGHTSPKTQEAALDLLNSLTTDNPTTCIALLESEAGAAVDMIVSRAKGRNERSRLLSCAVLANLAQAAPQPQVLASMALPITVNLLRPNKGMHSQGVVEEAPRTLARLVQGNFELQKAACEADAIPRLATLLKAESEPAPRLLEATLAALAALTERWEQSRQKLLEARVLDVIVRHLSHTHAGVRVAACRCCLSLSRSVKNLRMALVDCNIATHLLRLLNDESLEVQSAASAPLCNMVLDFSAIQEQILNSGGLSQLAALTQSRDNTLRLNSTWALKNLLFVPNSDAKRAVMRALPYCHFRNLLMDQELQVQAQALNLLRNLVHGQPEDISAVLEYSNHDVLQVLESKLATMAHKRVVLEESIHSPSLEGGNNTGLSQRRSLCELHCLEHALYIASNVATGLDAHKDAVMETTIPTSLVTCLKENSHAQLKIAALWGIINLGWQDNDTKSLGDSALSRLHKLQEMGLVSELISMSDDASIDVKDRVRTALGLFEKAKLVEHLVSVPNSSAYDCLDMQEDS